MRQILKDVVNDAHIRKTTQLEDKTPYGVFYKDYAPGLGIAVCGEFDENGRFLYEYYFPYIRSGEISSREEISLERQAAQNAYEGMVDEVRVGVSLIFYLANMPEYLNRREAEKDPLKGATLTLGALAESGTIMLPLMKTRKERADSKKKASGRYRMIAQAKKGNEEAIESLTLEDMDMYTAVSKKIKESDVFTLVDTYFMPFGVECDRYSVLGEILSYRRVENNSSKEGVYLLRLLCNDLLFDLAVNEADLKGEPKVGRRFKGNVWMQGWVNFAT